MNYFELKAVERTIDALEHVREVATLSPAQEHLLKYLLRDGRHRTTSCPPNSRAMCDHADELH